LKERSKKPLDCRRGTSRQRAPKRQSFLVLFFKKELLASLKLTLHNAAPLRYHPGGGLSA
jgi:hypothetical protein